MGPLGSVTTSYHRSVETDRAVAPTRGAMREALAVGAIGTLLLLAYEWVLLTFASDRLFAGYRFQAWSSNDFMQEVKIQDLVDAGPVALWYLHVQPPVLEALRLILSFPEYLTGGTMTAQMIDQRMYVLYAVFYGALLFTVFLWVRTLTRSRAWAYVGAVAIGAYPGTIAMATLLDGTFPSAVLATVMLFLLYLAIRQGSPRLLNWWLLSLVLLSFTRTIFQLQILIFMPVVVFLLYRYRMRSAKPIAVVLSVILTGSLFLLPAKQYVLYDTTATTSFAGNHQIEVVSYRPTDAELAAVEVPQDIIGNAEQFDSGFNSPENVELNYILTQVGNDYYLRDPFQVAKNLLWGVQMNTFQAFRWTHDYSIVGAGPANIAADLLPWTPPSNVGLSWVFYWLVLLVTVGALLYVYGIRGLMQLVRTYAALAFIVATTMLTFLLANRYDWTEADRLKYILVPFFCVVFISTISRAAQKARARRESISKEPALESRPI